MNFKKIKFFDVLGKKVKVVFRDMNKENICGHFVYDEDLIEINNQLNSEIQEITIMHELIHAVFARAGIHNARVSADIEEIIADQVSKVILENFKLVKR